MSGWRKSGGTAMRGHSVIQSTCDQAESWRSRSQVSETAMGPAWARLAPGLDPGSRLAAGSKASRTSGELWFSQPALRP